MGGQRRWNTFPCIKYTPHHGPRNARYGRDKGVRDEMPKYRSRIEVGAGACISGSGGDADVEFMQHVESIGEVVSLERRWLNSWATSLHARYVFLPCSLFVPQCRLFGCPRPQRPEASSHPAPLEKNRSAVLRADTSLSSQSRRRSP